MKKLLLIIFAILALTSCTRTDPQTLPKSNQPEATVQSQTTTYSFEATQGGTTAFDLFKSNTNLGYQEYDFGVFINEVNSLKSDDKHFWAFYHNGQFAQQSADQTILQPGDTITLTYEAIKN